ncbi:MAG TPA: lamin tail domain-containing protein [Candidatus Saccharimonadales bacterium]|nr:lamin tail domain-containing protein [Candidatus Saccharimonadales bacterium]
MFKRLIFSALFSLLPLATLADSAGGNLVISEVQTGTSASASQEFVELYNPTAADISLAGWTIEYKSATGDDTAWTKRGTLDGTIKSYGFYLAAPKSYLSNADADWSPTLASTGGNIRIEDANGAVVDQLGYGAAANAAETAPASAPVAGQSLERLPGRLVEEGGNATDTNDNSCDFIVRTTPLPQNTASETEVPQVDTGDPNPAGETAEDQVVTPAYLPVEISELFIDPAAPLTDAHDEYIELHNSNNVPVDLTDYVLKAGSSFHDYFVLPNITLAPDAYLALYSDQTHISLTNSGGAAELLDPLGNVVAVTEGYGDAPTGQAWGKFAGGWQWTLQNTPGEVNILLAPVVVSAKTSSAKTTTAHKAAAKAAKPKAVKKSAIDKHKTAKAKVAGVSTPKVSPATIHASAWLIAGLAVLTIAYASYEFRYDIRNFYYRFRGHKRSRS